MRTKVKYVYRLLMIAVGGGVLYLFAMWEPFVSCGDTVVCQSASPDGRTMATLFERNCGATTSISTQACLHRASKRYNSKMEPFLVLETTNKVTLSWESQHVLAVHLPMDARLFRKVETQDGVAIKYLDQPAEH